MKTKLFLFTGLLVFAGFVSAQNENRQSRAAAMEAKVKKAVDSGRFCLVMNQAQPMVGGLITLTAEYTLTMAQDSAIAFLPYFGRAYSAPMDPSEGGIKFSGPVMEKKVVFNEKKKGYEINFSVRTRDDVYRLYVNVWLNGTADINVISNNRQSISFSGDIRLPD